MEMIELKSIITKIKWKKSVESFNSRTELAEERVSKLQDISIQ